MSVAPKVLARLNRIQRGVHFPIGSFCELDGETSVQKAFSRLVQEGGAQVSKCWNAILRFSENIDLPIIGQSDRTVASKTDKVDSNIIKFRLPLGV